MTKKRKSLIVLIIISILLVTAVVGYHYLQLNHYFDQLSFLKIVGFGNRIRITSILKRREFQNILIGSMYVSIFFLIGKLRKSFGRMKPFAVLFGVLFALHIFIDDTFINYGAYNDHYYRIARLTLTEFMFSGVWSRYISKYGFFILLINFGFMCALLLSIFYIKAFKSYGCFFDSEKYDQRQSAERALREMIVDYNEADISSLRIIELYLNDRIGYKMVVDYIEMLPPNDMDGYRNLIFLEETIAELHPIIEAGVRKAKETKYKRLIEKIDQKKEDSETSAKKLDKKAVGSSEGENVTDTESSHQENTEDTTDGHEDNVIKVDFTRKNQ